MCSVLVCRSQIFHRNILNSTKFCVIVKFSRFSTLLESKSFKVCGLNRICRASRSPKRDPKVRKPRMAMEYPTSHPISLSIQVPLPLQWSGKLHHLIIVTVGNEKDYEFHLKTFTEQKCLLSCQHHEQFFPKLLFFGLFYSIGFKIGLFSKTIHGPV